MYPMFASMGGRTWFGMKLHPYYQRSCSQNKICLTGLRADCRTLLNRFLASKTRLATYIAISTALMLRKGTYSSNGMSKKPGGTHAERPILLSLNSRIDSPYKGLRLTSVALRKDQECVVPGSYPEISMGNFSAQDI